MIHKVTYLRFYKWTLFLTIVWCCVFSTSQAQTTKTDSLQKQVNTAALPDTTLIGVYVELAEELMKTDRPQARDYLQKAINLSLEIDDTMRAGDIANELAYSYFVEGNFELALRYNNKADTIYSKSDSPYALAAQAMNKSDIANIQVNQSDYEEAIETYQKALQVIGVYQGAGKEEALAVLQGNIAGVFNDMHQFEKALSYDLKSLEVKKKSADSADVGMQLLAVAGDYINLKKTEEAQYYLMQADSVAHKINSPHYFYQLYMEWGRFYRHNDDTKAMAMFQRCLQYAQETNSEVYQSHALRMMGYVCRDMKLYRQSKVYLQSALTLYRSRGAKTNEAEILKNLAVVSAAGSDYHDATNYYAQFITLGDSLNEQETKKKINEIENRYQVRQKADSILVLKKSVQLQQLALHKKENQNIFIITSAALLLLAGVLFYRNLQNRHRLLRKTEQLYQQQIDQLEKEHRFIAVQSLMKGQEEERSRLAKDLHDGVGGLLSGVKLGLANMKGNVFLSEENVRAVTTIIAQLDDSINELRRVSHNMMPEALIKYGLKEALENYCENINQSGKLNVKLQTYGLEQRLEQDTEIILYRIVQELLNNTIKHAEATQVLVQLMCEENKFTLTVEDDGKGFEADNPACQNGAGLQNIRARAGYLNGTVDIRTRPGEGASVTIEGKIN